MGWCCISPPQAAVPPNKQPSSLVPSNPPVSKGSDQGFQSPPASSSSVTINTAPFQAMQTVSMKREWWLQFIIPVKKPLFLLYLLLSTVGKICLLYYPCLGWQNLHLSNGNIGRSRRVLNPKPQEFWMDILSEHFSLSEN